ncbi:hypothetical protein AVEN_235430-1 [Araneus ventricosus]|uniref:Uncharacterized protein n=1 Tax=Araneus ventricosus TaxID=182803 RepID=A0A4Y2A3X0_ARAVE|nr:hypothetical protein AVEN_235430-1 [Araneus ventricosus]
MLPSYRFHPKSIRKGSRQNPHRSIQNDTRVSPLKEKEAAAAENPIGILSGNRTLNYGKPVDRPTSRQYVAINVSYSQGGDVGDFCLLPTLSLFTSRQSVVANN